MTAPIAPATRPPRWSQTASRFGLLMALGLLWYSMFELTQPQMRAGAPPVSVKLFPVPAIVWYTTACLLFGTGLWVLLRPAARPRPPDAATDLAVRRLAIAAVTVAYGFEIAARALSGRLQGLERLVGWESSLLALLGCGVLAIAVRRPPPAPLLAGLLVGGGVAVRLFWLSRAPLDASYSDNLVVVHRGLERLTAGKTPYAFFQFDTHVQPLPYLPWTVLSYLPPFAAGLDIRLTNIVCSAGLVLALIWTVRALGTPPVTRNGLTLAASVFFVLPIAIGQDAYATWSLFNLASVLAFGLGALGRTRWAAAGFGIALGSQTVAAYLAAPFLALALRSARGREAAVSLAMLAALASGPMLFLLIWDADAFLSAVTTVPLKFWAQLDDGSWRHSPFAIVAWYPLLGGRLRIVQPLLGLAFATLAWRNRATPSAGVPLAIGSFVSMVFTGPYIAAHMFALPLYLTVLAEAIRASSPEAAERVRVTDEERADAAPRSPGR